MPNHDNTPIAADQRGKLYANDPSGYWSEVAQDNKGAGLASVLPGGTLFQADKRVESRLLSNQISWKAVNVIWGDITFEASLNDGQMSLQLDNGGTNYEGSITLIANKAQFGGNEPQQQDMLQIDFNGTLISFNVTNVAGQFNSTDEALTLTCSVEDVNES